jgi:dihydrofolate reductase
VRNVIYSMGVSLDGFIAGPAGDIDWSAPDPERHQFHNDQTRGLGVHLCGRRLYEVMSYWDTAAKDPALGGVEREFASIWTKLPKIVFSSTLDSVGPNARLASESLADEIETLKRQPGGDIAIGGAGLASAATRLGLIDEYRLFLNPVLVGGGTPFFAALDDRIDLDLVETCTFGSRVVYARYRRA